MIGKLKRALPWWAKIPAKMALARLPVGGRGWQALGLFEPGEMDNPDYALTVFRRHFEAAGSPRPGFSFLELGPGDSLASAMVGQAFGAARCWLVDAGAYASRDMAVYRRLGAMLVDRPELDPDCRRKAFAAARDAGNIDDLLAATNAAYLEHGLDSLRDVPADSCDMVFSQAVLEHVPRAQFAAVCAELARILRPGGVTSHQIDFRDHLSGGLNNLRFSHRLWESPWFAARSGFYTNRLRHGETLEAFLDAGLEVLSDQPGRWPASPIARHRIAADLAGIADEDLRIRETFVVLTRPAGRTEATPCRPG